MARPHASPSAAQKPRRALVTGASTGLGAVFATALAQRGYDLVIVARSQARLQALASRLYDSYGSAVEVVVADLTQPTALEHLEEQIVHGQALDLLVNNAGFGTVGPFASLDPQREIAEIQLNVVALLRLTRAALPGMIARRQGGIINVSSLSALVPGPYDATYGATKAFVNSFTESLHEELRGTGVRVQALCPGFTHTEFQQRAGMDVSALPAWLWMPPEPVVEASLAALQRGQVVCVPGLGYRLLACLIGLTPRPLMRRLTGLLARRVVGH
ncbi:MAG: SDR family NAD(P)-dependent oxidoreductase [Candidatus Tectimicrobiota bacterium]